RQHRVASDVGAVTAPPLKKCRAKTMQEVMTVDPGPIVATVMPRLPGARTPAAHAGVKGRAGAAT
ncbi:MAG TPA: hypothetical protein VIQ62_00230, partial [Burkholderiales bacterium]